MRRVLSFSIEVAAGSEVAKQLLKVSGVKGLRIDEILFYGDADSEPYLTLKLKPSTAESIPEGEMFRVTFAPVSVSLGWVLPVDATLTAVAINEDNAEKHRVHLIITAEELG